MELLTLLILSYLTGSIPTSIIISRLVKNIDIREYGSGNAEQQTSIVSWVGNMLLSYCS